MFTQGDNKLCLHREIIKLCWCREIIKLRLHGKKTKVLCTQWDNKVMFTQSDSKVRLHMQIINLCLNREIIKLSLHWDEKLCLHGEIIKLFLHRTITVMFTFVLTWYEKHHNQKGGPSVQAKNILIQKPQCHEVVNLSSSALASVLKKKNYICTK